MIHLADKGLNGILADEMVSSMSGGGWSCRLRFTVTMARH